MNLQEKSKLSHPQSNDELMDISTGYNLSCIRVEEFALHPSSTNKLDKVLQDIQKDEETLPEMRWPYKGTRSKPKILTPPVSAHFLFLNAPPNSFISLIIPLFHSHSRLMSLKHQTMW
jgi:hypothetical protein